MTTSRGRTALATMILIATACSDDDRAAQRAPQPIPDTLPPTASRIASTMPPPSPNPVKLEPGIYDISTSAWSVADLEITLPTDWTVQYGHVFHKHPDTPQEIGFYPVVIDSIYGDACAGDRGSLIDPGAGVDDLTTALLQQPGAVATGPVATVFGGYPASRIDLVFPADADLEACSLGGDGLQMWYSQPADKYFVLAPDGIARVYIVDVDGERQVFLIQYRSETPDEDVDELDVILDSIVITPTVVGDGPEPTSSAPVSAGTTTSTLPMRTS